MVAVESVTVACRLTPPDLSGSDGSCLPSPTPLLIEQLKQELCFAADNNSEGAGISVCNKLERLNLTKECLEATRVGGVVNEIRKKVQDTCPKLSAACRSLIKQWRKQTDTYARAGSSCGGSNGVTPSMVSPAMKRLLTPQTPHRLADGLSKSQISSPRVASTLNSSSTNPNLVAQAVEKVNLQNGGHAIQNIADRIALKRKNEVVSEAPFKRSKSALIPKVQIASPQLSLSAVRRDAQSTAELVAQLSENLPQQLAPDLSAPKSNSVSPNAYKVSRPQQPPMVQDDRREKRKYTKKAAKFFKNDSDTALNDTNDVVDVKPKSKKAVASVPSTGKKIDWYAAIPSIEQLEERAASLEIKSRSVTKMYVENTGGRDLVCLPFVDVGIPDVDEYNYPAEENPKIECRYPRASRYVLKGI